MKVLPLTQTLLSEPVARALRHPEPQWDSPRPTYPGYGAAPGAKRVVVFSGLDSGERSAVVNCIEARGMPRVAATSLTEKNQGWPCGEVVAAAVRADRRYVRVCAFPPPFR